MARRVRLIPCLPSSIGAKAEQVLTIFGAADHGVAWYIDWKKKRGARSVAANAELEVTGWLLCETVASRFRHLIELTEVELTSVRHPSSSETVYFVAA